ncbi:MAG: hypothetical protein AAGB34_08855 [Planctomycetota bacterium]
MRELFGRKTLWDEDAWAMDCPVSRRWKLTDEPKLDLDDDADRTVPDVGTVRCSNDSHRLTASEWCSLVDSLATLPRRRRGPVMSVVAILRRSIGW